MKGEEKRRKRKHEGGETLGIDPCINRWSAR